MTAVGLAVAVGPYVGVSTCRGGLLLLLSPNCRRCCVARTLPVMAAAFSRRRVDALPDLEGAFIPKEGMLLWLLLY